MNFSPARIAGVFPFARWICGLAMTVFAISLHAQVLGPEVRLTSIQGPSYTPHIAAHAGNLHVVWWEDQTGSPTNGLGEIYYLRSTNNGSSWSSPVNLSNAAAAKDQLPVVAAGPLFGGTGSGLHVFWTADASDPSNLGKINYRSSVDGGVSFQAVTTPWSSGAVGYSRPGSALVDSAGRLHFAWYDSRYTPGVGQVMYALSCDNGATWSPAQFVTRPISSADSEAPRLVEDSGGNLYMMIRSSLDGNPQTGWAPFAQYLVRANSVSCGVGASWVLPPQRLSRGMPSDLGNTYGGKIVAGTGGRLHAAYWQESNGNNVVFRSGLPRSQGWGGWAQVSKFGPDHPEWDGTYAESSGIALVDDLAGGLHAVMTQFSSVQPGPLQVGTLKYLRSADAGATWTDAIDVSGAPYATQVDGVYAGGKLHLVWSDIRDFRAGAAINGSEIYYRSIQPLPAGVGALVASPSAVDFGFVTVGSTSARTVKLTNSGTVAVNVGALSVNAPFQLSGSCASIVAGASCSVSIAFAPTSSGAASGPLTVVSDGLGSPQTVSLTGSGGVDLIERYYVAILGRPSDPGGKAFWQGEIARMQSLGVDPIEVYLVMAGTFFNSSEYTLRNRNDNDYVTDLFLAFFNRAPDASGLDYWKTQILAGMPRNLVMYNFLFSPEFKAFMAGMGSTTPSRAEVYAVIDFFRGFFGRLPDTAGFSYWLGRFRTAQCLNSTALYAEVNNISSQFLQSAEYQSRSNGRPLALRNAEYVSDLYYAFLRRGGDLAGFQHWVNLLASGTTWDSMRMTFVSSTEFTARVNAIIAQGCLQ
jgi:hypothetical protein